MMLKRRVQLLEQTKSSDGQDFIERLVSRVGALEESLEQSTEYFHEELKASYRHISAAWNLVEQLQKQVATLEKTRHDQGEKLSKAGKELQDLRNRHLELLDSEEILEERIERLEHLEGTPSPGEEYESNSAARRCSSPLAGNGELRRPCPRPSNSTSLNSGLPAEAQMSLPHPEDITSRLSLGTPRTWTVHVSVLPGIDHRSPYPKDSQEYKRCLSRGLHQMVAVEGSSGAAFKAAIRSVFRHILKDKPWLPLQIVSREHGKKHGLPCLKPLDGPLIQDELSLEFLYRHCATHDDNGHIEALYLAVFPDGLPWTAVKRLPVFTPGLESSWAWNERLDGAEGDMLETARKPQSSPSPASSSASKRAASEMSHSGGVQETCERANHRAKLARSHMTDLSEMRREVEIVK